MASFPEIRVTRTGQMVVRVQWDPCQDGASVVDLTGMKVLSVETVIDPFDTPRVEVTFMARLVEVEA